MRLSLTTALSLYMKTFLTLLMAFLLSACTSHVKTGQVYLEDSPSFYMSVAPSYSAPFEYELVSDTLIFREYSGSGGNDWGTSKEVARETLSTAQKNKLRELSVAAVKSSVQQAEVNEAIIVLDGTSWYLLTDYGFGPFLSTSTNDPQENFYQLRDYVNGILGIE